MLAGCGGGGTQRHAAPAPRLPRALAQQLAAQSGRIAERLAANDSCTALAEAIALRANVTSAINAHRVPKALLEPLSSAANDLVARIGACVQPPAPGEHGQKSKDKHGHGKHEQQPREG